MLAAGDRFRSFIRPNKANGCHEWTSAIQTRGYGSFCFGGKSKSILAHRFAWELERGPIGSGLQLDHLCRNRRCVNVEHLEAVTPLENTRRGIAARRRSA